jgi:hypothetical protein
VYYEVLNQKGTPALYSDNYAQRPAAGYQGRIFYSPDTAQIFYDTGSTWILLADAGVGSGSLASVCANGNTTATGISITAGGLSTNSLTSTNLTAGSIPFIGTGGLFSQDNTNFVWDNTNKRLGINTNSPSVSLDVHGTTGVLVQVNNTGAADSKIAFLQASTAKWRIGNLYNAGANSFHIYNNSNATTPLVILSDNSFFFNGTSAYTFAGTILANLNLGIKENVGTTSASGCTTINMLSSGATNTFQLVYGTSNQANLVFNNAANYSYTFPSATGTLALTSNLSSYLPLAGGTLSGALTINSTLYINPTNTGLTGLDVASNNTSFRSDNLEGSKRQLLLTMGSGTLIQFSAQGYGAARGTDLAFYTSSASGLNGSPAIYMTGGNNIGILTGSPTANLDVNGTGRIRSTLLVDSYITTNSVNITSTTNATLNFSSATSYSNSLTFAVNSSIVATLNFGSTYTQYQSFGTYGHLFKLSDGTNALALRNDSTIAQFDITIQGTGFGFSGNGYVSGNFGVGTTSPSAKFQVVGDIYVGSYHSTNKLCLGADPNQYLNYNSTLDGIVIASVGATAFYTNSNERMRIRTTGEVGINTGGVVNQTLRVKGFTSNTSSYPLSIVNSSDTDLFYVRSDGAFNSGVLSSFTTGSAANMYVDPGNGFLYRSTSSLKYKKDVLDYNKGLDVIKQMRPVYYKGKNDGDKQFAGFIAEEIHDLGLTEFVQYAADETPDALAYQNMTALLTKGIQQLDTRLTNVEEALLTLQQNLN